MEKEDRRLLLHCCCGPCSTTCIERLLEEGIRPVLFFSNSNIFPSSEFEKRYGELLKVADHYGLQVIREEQDHDAWREAVRGHEDDREGGERCSLCFRYNLQAAAAKAHELGIPEFTTTLTVSRFKNSARIFAQGDDLEGFRKMDFKKRDGFNRSIQLSRQLDLYRQDYCGCEFSMRDRG